MMLFQNIATTIPLLLLLLASTTSVVDAQANSSGSGSRGGKRRRLDASPSLNLAPAAVGQHGRKLAQVTSFGDATTTNFRFLKDQVEAISPRTGCKFADEEQVPLPYTGDLSSCKSECGEMNMIELFFDDGDLVMNQETCEEGCECAHECGGNALCIARCQSTWNGYIVEPDGLLEEADTLAVCQYGEIPQLDLEIPAACDTVQEIHFDGVKCCIDEDYGRRRLTDGGVGGESDSSDSEDSEDDCPIQIGGVNRRLVAEPISCKPPKNSCECTSSEGEKCDARGPFCDDEAPFVGPGRASCGGGSGGDPHFKSWTGKWYDYSGACDLHLLYAPNFGLELMMDLTIDIRTTTRYDYSYIESAVVVIGGSSFEVNSFGAYTLDGVSMADLPNTISGFPIRHSVPHYDKGSGKNHVFTIEVDGQEAIVLTTYKDLVSIKVEHPDKTRFSDSVGMMGDYSTGTLLGKDGVTVIDDPNMLAKEWQVKDDEPMLFTSVRAPQYPQECILPEPTKTTKRRLGKNAISLGAEKTVSLGAAQAACAGWTENKEGCVHDVMSLGDLDAAASGGF